MYDKDTVMKGIEKFIDNEVLNKMNGWRKWVVGTGAGIAMSKAHNIFDELKNNEIVKMLELIDENDKVDVETLYSELLKQAEKGSAELEIPMIGTLTLKEQDIHTLYNYIRD